MQGEKSRIWVQNTGVPWKQMLGSHPTGPESGHGSSLLHNARQLAPEMLVSALETPPYRHDPRGHVQVISGCPIITLA